MVSASMCTHLFSRATLERLLLYISPDLSGPGNVIPIMISDSINHQLLKTFVAVTINSLTLNRSGEIR